MTAHTITNIYDELSRYLLENNGTLILESDSKSSGKSTLDPDKSYKEGAKEIYKEKRSKRSAKLRKDALIAYPDLKCYVCGFNFESQYGKYGAGYIEVHHLELLADSGEREHTIEDVRIVCSNCHSVLHRQGREPMDINELKDFVETQKRKDSLAGS